MKFASIKTLKKNRKTRRNYAYRALERESLFHDTNSVDFERADKALSKFFERKLSKKEELEWALRELEYKQLTSSKDKNMKIFTKKAFNQGVKRISAESGVEIPKPSKGTWEAFRRSGASPIVSFVSLIQAKKVRRKISPEFFEAFYKQQVDLWKKAKSRYAKPLENLGINLKVLKRPQVEFIPRMESNKVKLLIPVGRPVGIRLLNRILKAIKKDKKETWKVRKMGSDDKGKIIFIQYMNPLKGTSLLLKFYSGHGKNLHKRKAPVPFITLIVPMNHFNKTLPKKINNPGMYMEYEKDILANYRKVSRMQVPLLVTKEKETLGGGKGGEVGYKEFQKIYSRVENYIEEIYKDGRDGSSKWYVENYNLGLDRALEIMLEFKDTITKETLGVKGELRKLIKLLEKDKKYIDQKEDTVAYSPAGIEFDRGPAMTDALQTIIDFVKHQIVIKSW